MKSLGLNHAGLLTCGFSSTVNPAGLFNPRLVESVDAEPGICRNHGYEEPTITCGFFTAQRVIAPNSWVVQGSTVSKM